MAVRLFKTLIELSPWRTVIYAQLSVTLLAVGLFSLKSLGSGIFTALGGMICTVPTLFFAFIVMRVSARRHPVLMLAAFNRAQLGKFLMTSALFILVFVKIKSLDPVPLFTGFIAAQSGNWLAVFLASHWQMVVCTDRWLRVVRAWMKCMLSVMGN